MSAFSHGGFGASQRLSATSFVVLGLLTFWVYSVLHFASVLNRHFQRRWSEIQAREDLQQADPNALLNFHKQGFTFHRGIPWLAAALFGLDGILILRWFVIGVVQGYGFEYWWVISTIGLTSGIFYLATVITMLWALASVRRHEVAELFITEQGAKALQQPQFELGGKLAKRWERSGNLIVLFLVIALPITFSPTIGAHLFLTSSLVNYGFWLPLACFVLAAVYHIWGTILLVGLYNQHLEIEAQHANQSDNTAHNLNSSAIEQNEASQSSPERELVAIMLTDMYGYSKQMEQNEAHAYTKLLEHNQIIRAAIAHYRGREIKTIGDAFLVVFRSAIDAVDCALTIQRSFSDFNLNRNEEERILVRIGIHLGDVLIVGDDVFGDGVNVAARIEPLAEPGGICVSEPVFEMVRKKIQLDVQKIEGSNLKNIKIAPNIYKIYLGS